MKIVVVGVGYVGLVSGTCFAELGHQLICVDTDVAKIDGLRQGIIPIYEPGLAELVAANSAAGRLDFTTDLATALVGADAAFIAVGTPASPVDGSANLDYVMAAARAIAAAAPEGLVVVTKSTVPVGTGDAIEAIMREIAPEKAISVVSNPEFLREGSALKDFREPDRVVVGVNDDHGREVLARIYAPLSRDGVRIVFTARRTSELIKYASNAFLATKIGFINEIADLCEAVGADVEDVSLGMGLDTRIGSQFLRAGPGYGGSCFPKDTVALLHAAGKAGVQVDIVQAVVDSNLARKRKMGERVRDILGPDARGKQVTLLGLTFKPNTDDMRESPAIEIVEILQAAGASIAAYDPEGVKEAQKLFTGVTYAADPYAACEGSDVVVLVTEWDMFRTLDLARVRALVRSPNLVDLRNVFDGEAAAGAGFAYWSIGKPPVAAAA